MKENFYHIYFKSECIYHSLPEEEFNLIWEMTKEKMKEDDLSYEKVIRSKELINNSSY